MAVFGFFILLAVLSAITIGATFILPHAGLDLGPAPWPYWVGAVVLFSILWCLLLTASPFTVVT